MNDQRNHSEGCNGITKADPIALEKICGDERSRESAQSEEKIQKVECSRAMVRRHCADQGVGSCNNDAAAHTEQEEQEYDAPKTFRAGQGEERNNNEGQSENETNLVALIIEQRAYTYRGDDQPKSLRERDGSILCRGEAETLGQFRQDRAQHGGDHPVNKDGKDSSEDQHASGFLSTSL